MVSSCQRSTKNRQLRTDRVERNKNFKAHDFKISQPIVVKNHLRNTFESKFIADYRVLEIVNDCTLTVKVQMVKLGRLR